MTTSVSDVEQIQLSHAQTIRTGERFKFGENWKQFLELLDEDRIIAAETSLKDSLQVNDLKGRRLIDVGSGSGLFSLAARRLGASVYSFDYDPASVACTRELKRRYFDGDRDWSVNEGSVLEPSYLKELGQFDVVYSWGVLHHTGAMWEALGNVAELVADNGFLFIAIYNDQGKASRRWLATKRLYNKVPVILQYGILGTICVQQWWRRWLKDAVQLRPFASWREQRRLRGMSAWRDLIDWAGGYPFEVAKPEQIFDFYRDRGFDLIKLSTQGGTLGCNEFVFRKSG